MWPGSNDSVPACKHTAGQAPLNSQEPRSQALTLSQGTRLVGQLLLAPGPGHHQPGSDGAQLTSDRNLQAIPNGGKARNKRESEIRLAACHKLRCFLVQSHSYSAFMRRHQTHNHSISISMHPGSHLAIP